MASFEIPIPVSDGTDFEFQTTLDGVKYWLLFQSNVRPATTPHYTLTLSDAGRQPIQEGIRCVVAWPLLIRTPDPRRPVGQLYLIDITGQSKDPGLLDLGGRVKLVYRQEG